MQRPDWIKEDGQTMPLSDLAKPLEGLRKHDYESYDPLANANIRCPMPATGIVSPDSLRQFYATSAPKFRVLTGNK